MQGTTSLDKGCIDSALGVLVWERVNFLSSWWSGAVLWILQDNNVGNRLMF